MNEKLFRTLALDLGDKYIGIAISDLSGTIAGGLPTLTRSTLEKDMLYVKNLIEEQNVKVVVLGLPINMDGSYGKAVDKTNEFAEELKKHTDAKIEFLDERLTTAIAERVLISADTSRAKRKKVIDKLAATIILQDYLNSHKRS